MLWKNERKNDHSIGISKHWLIIMLLTALLINLNSTISFSSAYSQEIQTSLLYNSLLFASWNDFFLSSSFWMDDNHSCGPNSSWNMHTTIRYKCSLILIQSQNSYNSNLRSSCANTHTFCTLDNPMVINFRCHKFHRRKKIQHYCS